MQVNGLLVNLSRAPKIVRTLLLQDIKVLDVRRLNEPGTTGMGVEFIPFKRNLLVRSKVAVTV